MNSTKPQFNHKCLLTPYDALYELLGQRISLQACVRRLEQATLEKINQPDAYNDLLRIQAEHLTEIANIEKQISILCRQIAGVSEVLDQFIPLDQETIRQVFDFQEEILSNKPRTDHQE